MCPHPRPIRARWLLAPLVFWLLGGCSEPTRPPIPDTVEGMISLGRDHTCAVSISGTAYCWGWNEHSLLGDGTTAEFRESPTAVAGGLTFRQISVSLFHTCGITFSGVAYCWGVNWSGRLGDGTNEDRLTPTAVAGDLTFRQISAGGGHTCGLTTSRGAAYCWGENSHGQLGDGTAEIYEGRPIPTPVAGGLSFAQIGTGEGFSCGLTFSGEAYCWGANWNGQLGTDTSREPRAMPTTVSGGLTFGQISVGGGHTCGLTAAGAAYCWGLNFGLVADSTTNHLTTPTAVAESFAFEQISAGGGHTCGLTATGAAHCWGWNFHGQLGNGTPTEWPGLPISYPTAVVGGLSFRQISTGLVYTCGITTSGQAYCWGGNWAGQLGIGARSTPIPTPRLVIGALRFR
jgi:alpha-tubulin suppressor-like RCC1 family protein